MLAVDWYSFQVTHVVTMTTCQNINKSFSHFTSNHIQNEFVYGCFRCLGVALNKEKQLYSEIHVAKLSGLLKIVYKDK